MHIMFKQTKQLYSTFFFASNIQHLTSHCTPKPQPSVDIQAIMEGCCCIFNAYGDYIMIYANCTGFLICLTLKPHRSHSEEITTVQLPTPQEREVYNIRHTMEDW